MGLRGDSPRDRLPALAFLASLVAALVGYEWYGRRFWFVGDEWDFLITNRLSTADPSVFVRTLLRPHNEHWSTLPRLWYWVADDVWGLRTYTPYLTAVILLHLGVAILLWLLIRRLGVHPWLAAGAGATMALFGPGAENILWGFQVGFVGSAFFGLAALLLADHAGTARGRDVAAALCGLAALLCSGIGVPLVVGLGIAVWFRRGLRSAAAIVVPLAVIFAGWYVAFGRANEANTVPRAGPSQWLPYILTQLANALEAITQFPATGGVVLMIALVFVGWRVLPDFKEARLAPMYGLLASATVLSLTTAIGRASLGIDQARSSRYVYLFAVFLLPLLAVMLDSMVRRERRTWLAAAAFVVIAIVGSTMAIPRYAFEQGAIVSAQRDAILAAATDPAILASAADGFTPSPTLSFEVTMAALRARVAAGDVPQAAVPQDVVAAVRLAALVSTGAASTTAPLSAGRVQGMGITTTTNAEGCTVAAATGAAARVVVDMPAGDPVIVRVGRGSATASIVLVSQPTPPLPVAMSAAPTRIAVAVPARLRIGLSPAAASLVVCGAAG